MSKRIPFDSVTLACVVSELKILEGCRVQRVIQPSALEVVLEFRLQGRDAWLLISAEPNFCRAHFITRKPKAPFTAPSFCMALRKSIEGARLEKIKQVGLDRIVELSFDAGEAGKCRLIMELMGKYSNVILVDHKSQIINALKIITAKQSRYREVKPHLPYIVPPPTNKIPIDKLTIERWQTICSDKPDAKLDKLLLESVEGLSPFLANELVVKADNNSEVIYELIKLLAVKISARQFDPIYARDEKGALLGAYPFPLITIPKDQQFTRSEMCISLDQYFNHIIEFDKTERLYATLKGQIQRALDARLDAMYGIEQALKLSQSAGKFQLYGELILTYGSNLAEGSDELKAPDYTDPDMKEVSVKLDPELSSIKNAERYFALAKKHKDAEAERVEQLERFQNDVSNLKSSVTELDEFKDDFYQLNELRQQWVRNGWLREQAVSDGTTARIDPFDGHKIKKIVIDGWEVLIGENSTSNDYLTQRIAKPNDWWFHVRGGTSAHVVIRTANKPDKVPQKIMNEAAKFAALRSPSKHSSLIPVDYTLKKYVRKHKKAPPGSVIYSNEKTLHISPSGNRSQ